MHTHIKKDNFTQESSAYAQVFFSAFEKLKLNNLKNSWIEKKIKSFTDKP